MTFGASGSIVYVTYIYTLVVTLKWIKFTSTNHVTVKCDWKMGSKNGVSSRPEVTCWLKTSLLISTDVWISTIVVGWVHLMKFVVSHICIKPPSSPDNADQVAIELTYESQQLNSSASHRDLGRSNLRVIGITWNQPPWVGSSNTSSKSSLPYHHQFGLWSHNS